MSRLARRLIIVSVLVALEASVATFVILKRIQAGVAASVDHKSAKSTTATVVSVAEINPSEAHSSDQLFRVCFNIDNFDQVETDMRQGYESAEAQRLAKAGASMQGHYKSSPSEENKAGYQAHGGLSAGEPT